MVTFLVGQAAAAGIGGLADVDGRDACTRRCGGSTSWRSWASSPTCRTPSTSTCWPRRSTSSPRPSSHGRHAAAVGGRGAAGGVHLAGALQRPLVRRVRPLRPGLSRLRQRPSPSRRRTSSTSVKLMVLGAASGDGNGKPDRRGRRRGHLGLHHLHGLHGALPGLQRAHPAHRPDAAAPGRRGRGRDRRPGHADGHDPLRELVRPVAPQPAEVDAGPRVRDQGRPQGARRVPLVRRRLRVVRPPGPGGDPRRGPGLPAGRPRRRDPLRGRAERRQRRPPPRRGGPLRDAAGQEPGGPRVRRSSGPSSRPIPTPTTSSSTSTGWTGRSCTTPRSSTIS